MILLEARDLSWIQGQVDDPNDLCAHGKAAFEIDGTPLVSTNDGEWTLSATALYLLRTLEHNHTRTAPLFEHLFPCCGFAMYDIEGQHDVVIVGCPNGIDFEITHLEGIVKIQQEGQMPFTVPYSAWRDTVVKFSESIKAFYASAKPKEPFDKEQRKGFEKFLAEWERRHSAAIQP